MFDLKGKVAMVTGGNGGIGLGMAKGLAQAGARVAVAARNADKSRGAVDQLTRLGGDAIAVTVDVADEASVDTAVRAVVDRLGRVDILVNNAGINIRKQPQEYTLAEWRHVLDTNLTSAFLCSRAVYPVMKGAGGGKIINIGQGPGRGLGPRQHPGQCRPARLDRHRAHAERPSSGPGSARVGPAADAGGSLGRNGRHGGRGRVSREPGVGFCDGNGHPRRRRLRHPGIADR